MNLLAAILFTTDITSFHSLETGAECDALWEESISTWPTEEVQFYSESKSSDFHEKLDFFWCKLWLVLAAAIS